MKWLINYCIAQLVYIAFQAINNNKDDLITPLAMCDFNYQNSKHCLDAVCCIWWSNLFAENIYCFAFAQNGTHATMRYVFAALSCFAFMLVYAYKVVVSSHHHGYVGERIVRPSSATNVHLSMKTSMSRSTWLTSHFVHRTNKRDAAAGLSARSSLVVWLFASWWVCRFPLEIPW